MSRKRVFILAAVAILIALFFLSDLKSYLSLQFLKEQRESFIRFYLGHRIGTVAAFVAIYIVQTALSLPGAAILSLFAGAVFGVFAGTLWAVLSATAGATVAFLLARFLFHDAVQRKFGKKLSVINREIESSGFNYLLFLRLVPLFPFFLINLAAALTKIPTRTYVLATLIGIIPGGFVYCNAGAGLAAINSTADIASPRFLGSLALIGLFALIPVMYRKIKHRDS